LSEKPLLFVRKASGLSREIGPWTILFFPLKASLNPWYFLFIATLPFIFPGVNPVISFSLAGVIVIIYGIVLALQMVCMPRAGGNYVVIARGLHPIFGMMEGWRAVIWNPIANATVSFLAAGFLVTGIKAIGLFTNSPGLVSTADSLNTTMGTIAIALILVFIGGLIDFFGAGTLKRSMVILSGITIIGVLMMIIVLLMVGPGGTRAGWDSVWGTGAYNEIMNVAAANGWAPAAFSWTSTMAAVLVCRGFLYPDNVSPLGGEMSQPRKTIMIGIGFSGVLLAFFVIAASAALSFAFGDFVSAYNFAASQPYVGQLTINPGLSPSLAVFAGSLIPNSALAGFLFLIPFISVIGLIPHGYYWTTRPFFAMAFDRYAPAFFAHVSDRWHIPTYSWLWAFIIQIIFVFVAAAWPIILSVSLFILGTLLVLWWSTSGITLPFTRPQIWARGIAIPIPLMVLLAVISTILQYFTLFTGLANVDILSLYITLAIIGIGMSMYAAMSYINMRRGIDVDKIFSEVPPE